MSFRHAFVVLPRLRPQSQASRPRHFFNGLLEKKSDERGWTYMEYDGASRLTREHGVDSGGSGLQDIRWFYDALGNRTRQDWNGSLTYYDYLPSGELVQVHDLEGDAWADLAYDGRGNCLQIEESDGTIYYEYNDLNLVTRIQYKDATVNRFWYGADNLRYAAQDSRGLRYFVWDTNGMNLLAERDEYGAALAEYSHGFASVDGSESVMAAKQVVDGVDYYQYPHYDIAGNVVKLTDLGGEVTHAYEYNAWGEPISATEGPAPNRLGYNANWIRLADSGGEQYLSPTRVYHSKLGRFLSRDLKRGRRGSYRYCGNNPVSRADAVGMCGSEATGKWAVPGTLYLWMEIDRLEKDKGRTEDPAEIARIDEEISRLRDQITEMESFARREITANKERYAQERSQARQDAEREATESRRRHEAWWARKTKGWKKPEIAFRPQRHDESFREWKREVLYPGYEEAVRHYYMSMCRIRRYAAVIANVNPRDGDLGKVFKWLNTPIRVPRSGNESSGWNTTVRGATLTGAFLTEADIGLELAQQAFPRAGLFSGKLLGRGSPARKIAAGVDWACNAIEWVDFIYACVSDEADEGRKVQTFFSAYGGTITNILAAAGYSPHALAVLAATLVGSVAADKIEEYEIDLYPMFGAEDLQAELPGAEGTQLTLAKHHLWRAVAEAEEVEPIFLVGIPELAKIGVVVPIPEALVERKKPPTKEVTVRPKEPPRERPVVTPEVVRDLSIHGTGHAGSEASKAVGMLEELDKNELLKHDAEFMKRLLDQFESVGEARR